MGQFALQQIDFRNMFFGPGFVVPEAGKLHPQRKDFGNIIRSLGFVVVMAKLMDFRNILFGTGFVVPRESKFCFSKWF